MLSLIKSKKSHKEGGKSGGGGGSGGGNTSSGGIFGGGVIGIRTGGHSSRGEDSSDLDGSRAGFGESGDAAEIVYNYEPSVGLGGAGGVRSGFGAAIGSKAALEDLVDLQNLPPPPPSLLSAPQAGGGGGGGSVSSSSSSSTATATGGFETAAGRGVRATSLLSSSNSSTSGGARMEFPEQPQQLPPALPARNPEQQQPHHHHHHHRGGGSGIPDRPPSRGERERPPSRGGGGADRPSSRNSNSGRTRQPRLGTSSVSSSSQQQQQQQQQNPAPSYLLEDDPGIMSEIETSSTRFRKSQGGGGGGRGTGGGGGGGKGEKGSRSTRPRTSPNQVPRGYSLPGGGGTQAPSSGRRSAGGNHHNHQYHQYYPGLGAGDDDSGIMSEAETSSTTRSSSSSSKRRSRSSAGMHGSSRHSHHGGGGGGGGHGSAANKHVVSSTLFEEDPGIMSEAETASTSSRSRKTSSSANKPELPVVRTPSKTLERPLGIVFLIYRGETKRALLPNEVTSIITVKALFVRSFQKVLTLDYMDLPRVRIYILEQSKDEFYELDDLGDVRDRAVLKVFEPDSSGKGPDGLGPAGLPPITNNDELAGYDLDPVDKTRSARAQPSGLPAYRSTLPRNAFSNADPSAGMVPPEGILRLPSNHIGDRSKTLGPGYGRGGHGRLGGGGGSGGGGSGSSSRVESGYVSSPDGNFEFDHHGQSLSARIPHASRFSSTAAHHHHESSRYYPGPASAEEAKARMMHMEAQLSQLTGLVEKALKNKRLTGGKKQVSFDKSVTFSDEQPPSILTTSKRHQSQKQAAEEVEKLLKQHARGTVPAGELHGQLKRLHRTTRELKQEVRVLRRLTQLQSMAMKDLVQDTYLKLREACISFSSQNGLMSSAENLEHWRIAQDEEAFSRELAELLASIAELETRVEEVRSGVINKKNKILIQDVESMAVVLSQCSKSVTQLRQAFPTLEANLRVSSSSSVDKKGSGEAGLMGEFLKRSSERLDNAWKRCKKLTGTLVTLKRLASVQEQRFHPGGSSSSALGGSHNISLSPTPNEMARAAASSSSRSQKESTLDDLLNALQTYTTAPVGQQQGRKELSHSPLPTSHPHQQQQQQQQQQPSKPIKPQVPLPDVSTTASGTPVATVSPLKKQTAPKPQVGNGVAKPPPPCPPPRTTTAPGGTAVATAAAGAPGSSSGKGAPPPPPPRTSSTHKSSDEGGGGALVRTDSDRSSSTSSDPAAVLSGLRKAATGNGGPPPAVAPKPDMRQDVLEIRHQELLSRQKQLTEQYQRLQEMSKKSKGVVVANSGGGSNGSAIGVREEAPGEAGIGSVEGEVCAEAPEQVGNGSVVNMEEVGNAQSQLQQVQEETSSLQPEVGAAPAAALEANSADPSPPPPPQPAGEATMPTVAAQQQ